MHPIPGYLAEGFWLRCLRLIIAAIIGAIIISAPGTENQGLPKRSNDSRDEKWDVVIPQINIGQPPRNMVKHINTPNPRVILNLLLGAFLEPLALGEDKLNSSTRILAYTYKLVKGFFFEGFVA